MSAACLRWALHQAVTGMHNFCLGPWRSVPLFLSHRAIPFSIQRGTALSTATDGGEEGGKEAAPRKKQTDPRARHSIGSVGRKIHQRHIQVIGHDGANLGTMHRADVLRLMDEKDLRLVPLNENKDPPVYQLMTGKQIHEEQLKLREKQKNKTGPIQVKELAFSLDIAPHDLDTKMRQIQSWLSKKCHVRVTLKGNVKNPQPLDSRLEEMVKQMPVIVGFVSKPKVIRNGRAAMCIVRSPTEKEVSQQGVRTTEPIQPPSTQSGMADANPTPDSTNSSPLQQ
ncbi:hypothetical protein JZ751_022625 [Albula glossodonta]|uniref:Translation initiation factor 3 N-terminal domain-containing protein n=1 Tax=Albula glossodonta TaxID=121402 RepID=A0A8T2PI20_9TELE|nr:hypothetical protein JZ751_022625 [Albula glossodonta]